MTEFDDNRPDPDELLASVKEEEEKNRRGKLKIFFGMCAGVGKTYSMLQTGISEKNKGRDVVIGYVETHDRPETSALTGMLGIVPRKVYEYRNTQVEEMDLDTVIQRHPGIVLVDELAHTNAPGSRHIKRYQDVLELLEAGIDVFTTLNVQHLESRSETVAQITGITVRETVPDELFENAEEIELVDLTPEKLLQRLSEGKVYTPERSAEAIGNFFRKGNINALREMALRIVADRVDKQLHDYLQHKRIRGPWKSGLHLLAAIDYREQSANLLRWAKNLSYSLGAVVEAVYVETSRRLTRREEQQLEKNIRLAKQLGIKFRIITHYDVVRAIVDLAQKENVTHILVGKPRIRNLFSMLRMGGFVNRLLRYSGSIDVYIYGSDRRARDYFRERFSMPVFTSNVWQYLFPAVYVILTSILLYFLKEYTGYQVVSLVLLFLVSILAVFYGKGPILLAATLSAMIWDYFFIPPPFTFHISQPVDVLMLAMFFIIALLNGILTSRIRLQEKKTRIREERTQALFEITKELSQANGIEEVIQVTTRNSRKYFGLDCRLLLGNGMNHLSDRSPAESGALSPNDFSIASWAYQHAARAGKFTDTLPTTDYTFYPLAGTSENIGVVAIRAERPFTQGEDQFWDAFLAQVSGKFEREFLRNTARKTLVLNESDKLYKTLFNSISHELRIPVATIMGASDTLLNQDLQGEVATRLLTEISTASVRLNRLIENLLNMSRLESGRIALRPDWCDIHDLANQVAGNLKEELAEFRLDIVIPANMPLVNIDFGLMEQVLHNLVLNATQHAPAGTNIRIKFFHDNGYLTIQVMDRGTGFPPDELPSVFNKFYRGKDSAAGGTGLGLSIVKGFVEAHHGTVVAENRKNGGAIFTIKLPVKTPDLTNFAKQEE